MSARLIQGVFDTEAQILAVTKAARDKRFGIVDVYTPYAVHGLEHAMGVRRSRLTWICFICGALGAGFALWFQYWTSAIDWPVNVGGKPFNSLPAFVPIAFEITVLFAGMGVVIALLARCGLLPGRRASIPHPRVTDDRFVLLLRLKGARHTVDEAREFLAAHGAGEVDDFVEEGKA